MKDMNLKQTIRVRLSPTAGSQMNCWIAMKFCTDINGPQGMNVIDFAETTDLSSSATMRVTFVV